MARASPLLLYSFALLLLAAAIAIQFKAAYYGDKQWEVLYAQMWLGGKGLYTDLFAVSTPLIFWLYGLPAALAQHTDIDVFHALVALGLGAIALSVGLSTLVIARHPAFSNQQQRFEFVLLLSFVLITRTTPIFFLDREHLFFVFTLPFLLRCLPSLSAAALPVLLRILVGLLAGIGFCIKPHCAVVLLGITLVSCWFDRSPRGIFRLENVIIYAVGLLYLAVTLHLYPEYFGLVMPMAMATYSATRDTAPSLNYSLISITTLIIVFGALSFKAVTRLRRDICYLTALFPFYYAYALLNNNWNYTYYPLSSLVLLIAGFVLWEYMDERSAALAESRQKARFTVGILLCLMVFFVRAESSIDQFTLIAADKCMDNMFCKSDDYMVREVSGPNGPLSFGAISTDFTRWTRLVHYANAPWVTRFPQLWMLPKLLSADADFMREHHWIFDYVANGFAEDMDHNKPQVMFVDDADVSYTYVGHVDLVGYFSTNPYFREAFSHYRLRHNVNLCPAQGDKPGAPKIKCSYDVYERISQ